MFITVGFTVGDSLFLTHVPQEKVHSLYAWGYVGIAVVTVGVTWMYAKVIGSVSRIALLAGMQFILLFSIFVFRQFIPSSGIQASAWLYFGLVVWIKVCGQISIMLFFSFAGDYFTTHDAKRLYPYIAGGLAAGSIVAGIIIGTIVSFIGSEDMLYICMGFLIGGIGFSLFIHKIGIPIAQQENSSDTDMEAKAPLSVIMSQSYIRLVFLAGLVGLMCTVIVDFQMKILARNTYQNSADLAVFFGAFYMYAGMVTLLFQFLVVKFLLRRLGIISCLMILPCIHIIMSILFYATDYSLFAGQTLFIIATASFFQDILSDSLVLPSRELLFLPLPFHIRVRAQAIMGGMIMSIGRGLGGLLIISLTPFEMPLFRYSLLVLGFALLWVILLVLERPKYRDTLVSSLKNNQLDATELRDMVQGSSIDFVLEELLKSGEEHVVRFTLDLLQDRPLRVLSTPVRELARESTPTITATAIELLGADGDLNHLDLLERAFTSTSDVVREAAVLAFCRIKKEKVLERGLQWLTLPDQVIRHAAIVGCGRYCGQAGRELIRPILQQMASSHAPEERNAAAILLRDIRNPANAALVENLLDDPDMRVRIAAVEACGTIRSAHLVPHLLQLYRSTDMRVYVLDALEQMPVECVPAISKAARDPHLDEAACTLLFQALASIGGTSAQRVLWEFFSGDAPLVIRLAAGHALWRLARHGPLQEVHTTEFNARLTGLCEKIGLLNQSCEAIGDRDEFACQLMNDHARLEIECLFQLLAFKYHARQMEKVCYNFFSSRAIQRANALELLDDILPRRIASGIVQLLDVFVEGATTNGTGLSAESVQRLMKTETWLRVVTTYHVNGGTVAPEMHAGKWLTEHERMLYHLLERISFLKKVPLFKDVPGNYLVPLAKIAHSMELKDGEILFHQEDRGDAMYLVCRGSVSVQVDGIEVNRMGAGDCIGEMSILDGAPRSAACIAEENTELLRISDRDYETIVKSQTSVALAVLRTLAGRLRQQTAKTMNQDRRGGLHHNEEKGSAQQSIKTETWPRGVRTDHLNGETVGTESERVLYRLLERVSFLKNVPLFKDVPKNYLVPLAKKASAVKLNGGEILFHQGDHGDAMYVICSGSISVQVDGVKVKRIGIGDCIGEMALLDGAPRSASCVAEEESDLLMISDNEFETIVKSQASVAFALLRTLAVRLRQQTLTTIKQEGSGGVHPSKKV